MGGPNEVEKMKRLLYVTVMSLLLSSQASAGMWICTQKDGTEVFSDSGTAGNCQPYEPQSQLGRAAGGTMGQPADKTQPEMKEGIQQFQTACQADVKQFCTNVEPGGGRIKECLLDHYKEVSDDCYGVLEKQRPEK